MNKTLTTRCRLTCLLIVVLVAGGIGLIAGSSARAQNYSGLSLKLYGNDPANTQNEYLLESDPSNPDELNSIKLLLVLKNISDQKINTKRGFSQVELYRALKVTDPCGTPHELIPDESAVAADAAMPRFRGGRPLIPAEVLPAEFVKSVKILDLRKLFPVMYELPGEYKIGAQLQGVRFFLTEYSEERGLEGVANHFSNWFGTIDADFGLDADGKPILELPILILPVSGGKFRITVVKEDAQQVLPLFGVPVKVFAGSLTQDPENIWEGTGVTPILIGATKTNGEAEWECDKCLAKGVYTVLAKYQNNYQAIEIAESDSGWDDGCSGVIEQTMVFIEKEEEPPSIAGDLNGDGVVDIADRNMFLGSYRKCSGDTGFLSEADYDGDGCVTLNDYRDWYIHYKDFISQ
jgi:hypothetical protein